MVIVIPFMVFVYILFVLIIVSNYLYMIYKTPKYCRLLICDCVRFVVKKKKHV